MKIPEAIAEAFKNYYYNCSIQKLKKWDKDADLRRFWKAAKEHCTCFEAIAGTFWLTWKRPRIVTRHDPSNWWLAKVVKRYRKGKWIDVIKEDKWIDAIRTVR
jgi:hypothetical protein